MKNHQVEGQLQICSACVKKIKKEEMKESPSTNPPVFITLRVDILEENRKEADQLLHHWVGDQLAAAVLKPMLAGGEEIVLANFHPQKIATKRGSRGNKFIGLLKLEKLKDLLSTKSAT